MSGFGAEQVDASQSASPLGKMPPVNEFPPADQHAVIAIRERLEPIKLNVDHKSEEELAVDEPSAEASAYDPFKYAS